MLVTVGVQSVSVATATDTPRPCYRHEGAARAACLKAKHERELRDRLAWPPRPTNAEIIRRIGMAQWRKAERVAYCETGGNIHHFPNGTYIGYLGMYRGTYGMGVEWTKGPGNPRGYRWPAEGATKAEQVAVGYQVASRLGWSAWGCGGA